MTPRRRAILILGLILLLIALIVAIVVMLTRAVPQQPTPTPAGEDTTPTSDTAPAQIPEGFKNPLIVAETPIPGNTAARQMAELFAERYGSYSNQGDYQNLSDLLPVMTARYRQTTEAFLETADRTPGTTYEGVTSVKVSTDVRSADDDAAVIAVTLQQSRASGSAAPTTGYRTLRMELDRVGAEWRVDAAAWEN